MAFQHKGPSLVFDDSCLWIGGDSCWRQCPLSVCVILEEPQLNECNYVPFGPSLTVSSCPFGFGLIFFFFFPAPYECRSISRAKGQRWCTRKQNHLKHPSKVRISCFDFRCNTRAARLLCIKTVFLINGSYCHLKRQHLSKCCFTNGRLPRVTQMQPGDVNSYADGLSATGLEDMTI